MERALTTPWFDEQNRMTPEELQTATFPMSRLGRRGYEEEPVREFLSAVHDEFVRLVNERTSLWQEVQRLRRRIIAGETDGDGTVMGRRSCSVRQTRTYTRCGYCQPRRSPPKSTWPMRRITAAG